MVEQYFTPGRSMHIHCLGLNYRTADVGLRERLAFNEESVKAALARLGCGAGCQPEALTEMVILSTCNRVEIYAVSPHLDFEPLEALLADVKSVHPAEFSSQTYRYSDEKAVTHLFRVAAGLDSMVLGEPQILGQVMNAFELARGQGAAGAVLSRLFQAALYTGKRARTETAIGHNPASISSVAVRLAEQVVADLKAAQVVVLGAGEMAELAVEALRKRGVNHILVVNRTMERAHQLADRWGGQASTFENLPEVLRRADILISSTGAPHTIVHTELVQDVMQARSERPLVIIDIAVPRDVEGEVSGVPGVRLYDLDSLHKRLEHSLAQRANEIPHVEMILAAEQAAFMEYLASLDVVPVIAAMRQQAETIRQAELEKTLRHLPELSPSDRQRLEALTQALVKKLLHAPITRLRSEAGTPQSAEIAAAARALFDLENQHDLRMPFAGSGNGKIQNNPTGDRRN
jgi:glutamyl-tRNA reductase